MTLQLGLSRVPVAPEGVLSPSSSHMGVLAQALGDK